MKKTTIKLMPDYRCYPLWGMDDDNIGDIDPTTLPLSPEMIARLKVYADEFDAGLNWDDPGNTPPATEAETEALEQFGLSLWEQLRQELSANYHVFYFSQKLRRVIHSPHELIPKELVSV